MNKVVKICEQESESGSGSESDESSDGKNKIPVKETKRFLDPKDI